MQLLRMLAFIEDGTMNNVPFNDHKIGHSQQSIKLLSLPVQQAMEMSPQLIQIPQRIANYPNMPLLKLPNHTTSQYAAREKRNLLVDIRNIQSNDAPKAFHLPLLSRSEAPSEPSLIQIPLVKNDHNSNLRLVKIPIKDTSRTRQPVKMNHRDFAGSENEYQAPMVPRANERASVQERPDDSSYTTSSKRFVEELESLIYSVLQIFLVRSVFFTGLLHIVSRFLTFWREFLSNLEDSKFF